MVIALFTRALIFRLRVSKKAEVVAVQVKTVATAVQNQRMKFKKFVQALRTKEVIVKN